MLQLMLCQQNYFASISFVSLNFKVNYWPKLSFLYLVLFHLTQTLLRLFQLPTPYGLFNKLTFAALITVTTGQLLQLWL